MTLEQIHKVLETYKSRLEHFHRGCSLSSEECQAIADEKRAINLQPYEKIGYLISMVDRALEMDDSEKLNRWLGFIQGALWSLEFYGIGALRDHNRSPETE